MRRFSLKETSHGERKIFFSVLGVCVLGGVVAFLLAGCVGIYLLSSRAWPIVLLSRIIPFPAAEVNGTWIPFSLWARDTNVFVKLAEQGKQSIPNTMSRPDIGRAVMQTLVRNQVIEDLAKEQAIQVTSSEVDAAFSDLQKTKTLKDSMHAMLQNGNWSDAEVKQQIVRPWLLGKRLAERLGSVEAADSAVQEAIKKADVRVFLRL